MCLTSWILINACLFFSLRTQAFSVDYRLVFALMQHAIICVGVFSLFAEAGAIHRKRCIVTTFSVHADVNSAV